MMSQTSDGDIGGEMESDHREVTLISIPTGQNKVWGQVHDKYNMNLCLCV